MAKASSDTFLVDTVRAFILGVVVVAAAGCSISCNGRRSVQRDQSCPPVGESSPAAATTGSGALIVTDISGSMQGFVQPGSVRLFTLHDALERAVRNAIASAEATPSISRCYLGSNLECQRQLNPRELDNAGTYSAKESRLELFMLPRSSKEADDNKAKPDPVDPYRIAVLITDGMEASAPSPSSAAPCMAGADPDCMAHLLVQRAQHGYGIWMSILLMPFKGNHYAERPLDNSMWERIQNHVSTLAGDSYFQGVSFSVKRTGNSVPFEFYQFEGVKPIMVLALSKDLQAGRTFIQQFTDSVKRESVVRPTNAVYFMELAPLSVRRREISKITLPPTAQAQGARPVIWGRKAGIYDYLIECDRNGVATLLVTSEEMEGEQVIPEGVKAQFNLVAFEESTLPQNNLSIKSDSEGRHEVHLSCQRIREGRYVSCLDLQADLTIDSQSNAFWNALHADNVYEAPERLFGLREMVQKVLAAVIKEPRVTDRARFQVERK